MTSLVQRLEERGLNCWPALETRLVDGWVVRQAAGHTKRANSATPLWPAAAEPDGTIARIEEIYAAWRLPAIFRMTPLTAPADLDARLNRRGYRVVDPTRVMTMDRQAMGAFAAEDREVVLRTEAGQAWLDAAANLNGLNAAERATLARMLGRLPPRRAFVAISEPDAVVSLGLGVIDGDSMGLFKLTTRADRRGRGLGRRIVHALLAWGLSAGAEETFLQVRSDNGDAVRLYERLGFADAYRYHCRVRD